jgi:hypothetical protein
MFHQCKIVLLLQPVCGYNREYSLNAELHELEEICLSCSFQIQLPNGMTAVQMKLLLFAL